MLLMSHPQTQPHWLKQAEIYEQVKTFFIAVKTCILFPKSIFMKPLLPMGEQGGKQTCHRKTLLSSLKSPSMVSECLSMAFYALKNYLVCIEYVVSCQLEFKLFKCLKLSWVCGCTPATPALECKAGKPQVQNSLA